MLVYATEQLKQLTVQTWQVSSYFGKYVILKIFLCS